MNQPPDYEITIKYEEFYPLKHWQWKIRKHVSIEPDYPFQSPAFLTSKGYIKDPMRSGNCFTKNNARKAVRKALKREEKRQKKLESKKATKYFTTSTGGMKYSSEDFDVYWGKGWSKGPSVSSDDDFMIEELVDLEPSPRLSSPMENVVQGAGGEARE